MFIQLFCIINARKGLVKFYAVIFLNNLILIDIVIIDLMLNRDDRPESERICKLNIHHHVNLIHRSNMVSLLSKKKLQH